MGFIKVNNDLFAEHSWYFRNALVRANYEDLSKGIHKTERYLLRFLFNLLLKANYELKNREMHINFMPSMKKSSEKTEEGSEKTGKSSEKIIHLIKDNARITIKELAAQLNLTTRAIEKNIAKLKTGGIIERIGGDKGGRWKVNN